jgi:hypothetical protein
MKTVQLSGFAFLSFVFFVFPGAFSSFHFSLFYFLLFSFLFPWIVSFFLSLFLNWGSEKSHRNSMRSLSIRRQVVLALLSVSSNSSEENEIGLKRVQHCSRIPYGITHVEGIIRFGITRIQCGQTREKWHQWLLLNTINNLDKCSLISVAVLLFVFFLDPDISKVYCLCVVTQFIDGLTCSEFSTNMTYQGAIQADWSDTTIGLRK